MPRNRRRWNLAVGVGKVGVVLLLIVVSGLALDRLLGFQLPAHGYTRYGGLTLFAASLYLEIRATHMLWTQGGGTPNPVDPPRSLVRAGPYRFTRNPLYIARLGVLLGVALVFGSPGIMASAGLLFALLHTVLLPREETRLRRRFGEAYLEYTMKVPRWVSLSSLLGTLRDESRKDASRRS